MDSPQGNSTSGSAVILANQEKYVQTLERFSKPLQARTTYNPDAPETPATGNDALYFRYFDATDQASFLPLAELRELRVGDLLRGEPGGRRKQARVCLAGIGALQCNH